MRTKILAGIAAIALAASSFAVPAQAAWHGGGGHWHGGGGHWHGGGGHWHGGGYYGGWGAPLAGFAAGAIIGGALASGPYYYGPGYYGGPAYDYAPGGDVAYCSQRFKSYNPSTGLYLGYDGHYHPCP